MRRVAAAVLMALACRPTTATREPAPSEGTSARPETATDGPSASTAPTARADVDAAPVPAPTHAPARSPATPPASVPASAIAFDRDAWPHWIDADGDCQDTRTEVLIAESEIPVRFADARRCEVASGRWRCPYTDRTVTDPRQLDVDHLVPLAHAHAAGAAAWDVTRRRDYANDLGDPDHLVAVVAAANRSKGARSVETWLPEEPGFRCEYVAAWHRIMQRWDLAEGDGERAAIEDARRRCAANDVPERPTKAKPAIDRTADAPDDADPGACCRVCKAGKACGDGCIGADKTCHKPVGCACPRP